MTAQEWLDIFDSQLGGFFATDYEKYAAEIIRAQAEQIEGMERAVGRAISDGGEEMNCKDCKYWLEGICTDEAEFFTQEGEPVCRYSPGAIEKVIPEVANLRSEINRLTAEIAEKDAECERLRVQLAGCGVAAMCNTERAREQQKCVEGDYGWSQSYQDVVNAVGREIELRDKLQAAESLAAARLADQEAIERHTAKMVAGEIMAEIDDLDTETDADFYLCGYIAANSLRYRIRKKYGVTE